MDFCIFITLLCQTTEEIDDKEDLFQELLTCNRFIHYKSFDERCQILQMNPQ